jgi:hypothetical protein
MFKKFNFTGKKKIVWKGNERDIIANLDAHPNDENELTILLSLQRFFPDFNSSDVIIEVYYGSQINQFNLGKFENIYDNFEKKIDVSNFPAELLKLRVKIIDTISGKLLGSADRIAPDVVTFDKDEKEKNKFFQSSLFNFKPANIDQPFTVKIQSDERPIVRLNKEIRLKDRLITDKFLQSILLTTILKEVLLKYLMTDDFNDDSWKDKILEFCEKLSGTTIPDRGEDYNNILQTEDLLVWIDEVCEAFASNHKFINQLLDYFESEDS